MEDNANISSSESGKRIERLQIMITEDELLALDNWRFAERMPSRSAAVRELLRRGLADEGFYDQKILKNQSSNYGILENEN
ncbi:MAG: hypothetical protein ABI832_08015 [bacterium]